MVNRVLVGGFECRFCRGRDGFLLIDLGVSPPSNSYLSEVTKRRPETFFPLRVWVCEKCWLMQAEQYSRAAQLFDDEYAYFSSFSESWLAHCKEFAEEVSEMLKLDSKSLVVEVGSNDGYLLQFFLELGIPVLGIEPTRSTASVSRSRGIRTLELFFGENTASQVAAQFGKAKLICANNVVAHVPDTLDLVRGFSILLDEDGVLSLEFPHLVELIQQNQFDTIYHEHFSYFSFSSICRILDSAGLKPFDVEQLPTHGGSLRVKAARVGIGLGPSNRVSQLIENEKELGVESRSFYEGFEERAIRAKNDLLLFLIDAKRRGKKVIGYGAAAKGNTLLNFAGIHQDLLEFVVDRNPEKVGKLLPGSRIPIREVDALIAERPDYVLILPWNLKDEIVSQISPSLGLETRFVTAVPELSIFGGGSG